MYLLIALLHAVPVFVVAAVTESKSATVITAVIMGAVGALTGSPAYIALDILAVVATAWVCLQNNSSTSRSKNETPSKLGLFFSGMLSDLVSIVLTLSIAFGIFGGAIIFYNRVYGDCSDKKLEEMKINFEQCRALKTRKK